MTQEPTTDESQATSDESSSLGDKTARLEARLARVEAQVRALTERLSEVTSLERARKQRGLIVRLVLLAVLVGLVFYLQSRKAGLG